ncbi:MAG: CotH kinase family protein, partial [Planctomycetales bacterium]|nr:CotH kinase family protein [Planctomycetales bacterium]
MLTPFRSLIAVVLWITTSLTLGVAVGSADEKTESPVKDDSADVFGLTRVWKIHLRISAENWKTMQPVGGGFPGFGPPPGGPPPGAERPGSGGDRKKTDSPPQPPARGDAPREAGPGGPGGPAPGFRPGSFGYEFDYVKADIELDGQTFKDVGLRFKGNGSYMLSAAGRKRPFKIDFNRFVDGQKFHGMQQLNLHNNVMDPTHVRQALSYPVFQAAGAASPRTAFAQVFLTVPGESEREFLGLYTLVEEVDKSFLRRHFQTDKGLLLKPEGTQGLEYKGEDWSAYAWYEAKSKPKKDEARRLIELTRLIHKADDEKFRKEIGAYLDLDQFAGFLAANTLLANMDSFLTHVHNYYLYLNPKTNRFVFLPWDMDLSMGAFFMAGSAEQLQELSISHPHVGENKAIERLLAMDEFNRTAVEILMADKARRAFDLSDEDPRLVAAYGDEWGQNALVARRLVEAGVSFVTISVPGGVKAMDAPGWDDHAINIDLPTIMRYRLPVYDQVVTTLINDIYNRGLDKRVLLIVAGEFGRTPKGTLQPGT